MKPLDGNWQKLGSAALRVAEEARRAMQVEKIFGPVPTDDDLRKLYPTRKDENAA